MNRLAGHRSAVAATLGVALVVLSVMPAGAGGPERAAPSRGAGAGPVAVNVPARPGQVLVKVKPWRSAAGSRAVAAAGGRAVGRGPAGWQLVAVPVGRERAAAARLRADPAVAAAVPNYLRQAASHVAEEVTWGVRSTRATQVWEATPPLTGAGVRVAVVDSGVDAGHEQLVGRVAPGFDVYGTRGRDDCGHGTAVAGVVAAAHDGQSMVGVAPDATIVPVKVLRHDEMFGACVGDDAAIARGIMWAADPAGGRADVINLSLSGPPPSEVLADAVAYAEEQGVLVVAASGNAGDRIPNYPAAYPAVVSVAALQPSAGVPQWWPFSTFGSVDIAAPGKAIPIPLATGVAADRLGAKPCPDGGHALCADGTSFAAPHVAGLAAILRQQHPEVATLPAPERVARLRQWLLGTAVDIAPTTDQRGVDLRTGHGRADAVAAVELSQDPAQTLLTWEVGERVLSATGAMAAVPDVLPAVLIATTGTGEPLAGREVSFTPASGGALSSTAGVTDGRGRVSTVFRSSAAGRRTSLTAAVDGRALPLESYVLQLDDNVPGRVLPASPFRDRLDVVFDIDDVFRVPLREGETLRANLGGVDVQRGEYVDMYLHGAGTRDVTNPQEAPLREDTSAFEIDPRRLSRTVGSDGVRYLHMVGIGTYRATWWIVSPGKVRGATASPSTFTPNRDGRADVTTLVWRTMRAGEVTVRVRNAAGRVIRTAAFGRLTSGTHAWRWDGRTRLGTPAREGTYRATVHWADGKGRISSSTARVRLSR